MCVSICAVDEQAGLGNEEILKALLHKMLWTFHWSKVEAI